MVIKDIETLWKGAAPFSLGDLPEPSEGQKLVGSLSQGERKLLSVLFSVRVVRELSEELGLTPLKSLQWKEEALSYMLTSNLFLRMELNGEEKLEVEITKGGKVAVPHDAKVRMHEGKEDELEALTLIRKLMVERPETSTQEVECLRRAHQGVASDPTLSLHQRRALGRCLETLVKLAEATATRREVSR